MNEKKTYLLQGVRFGVSIEGYLPKQPSKKLRPFFAVITVDQKKENQGILISENIGNHQLYKLYVDSSHISFEIRYGDHVRFCSLYRTGNSWTGSYWSKDEEAIEIFKQKSVINCLVTPIEENLLDKPETLNGLPFIGEFQDWSQSYKWHLEGPNKEIPYNPKTGVSIRKCSNCFYRNYEGAKDSDCHCGENGDLAKISFRIPQNQFMPEQIDGKEVGHFCPHWTDPAAD